MMSVDTVPSDVHPTDGEILSCLDGECSQKTEIRIRDHLARCDECTHTVGVLQSMSERVEHALVTVASPPSPADVRRRILAAGERARTGRGQSSTRWLRLAAVLVVGVSAGLWVSPVRAWVSELFFAPETAPVVAEDPAPTAPPTTSVVSFVPSSATFTVQITHRQTAGRLVIGAGGGDAATARVTNRDPADEIFVTAGGLQVRNTPGSTATYDVRVPASVRSVVVRIGEEEIATYRVADLAESRDIVFSR